MKTNPLKEGVLIENSTGIGTVTRGMVRQRALELATINGHTTEGATKGDWEQAKRELTGDPAADTDAKESTLESATEAERWDPLPGSAGKQAAVSGSEDEDEEGKSDNTRLTEEGMSEADHDQMRQSARDSAK